MNLASEHECKRQGEGGERESLSEGERERR